MIRMRISRWSDRVAAVTVSTLLLCSAGSSMAQQVLVPNGSGVARLPSQDTLPAVASAANSPAAIPKTSVVIPEGAEVRVRLNERLSSATNTEGDEFSITTDEPIELADGTVIPAGFRGKGEVTAAHKKGMLGKAGELHIRLNYFRIGNARVPLRADKGGEGKSGVGTTVVLTVLITPLFLMHHGAEIVYPRGQKITAFVDEDTRLSLPMPSPPEAE